MESATKARFLKLSVLIRPRSSTNPSVNPYFFCKCSSSPRAEVVSGLTARIVPACGHSTGSIKSNGIASIAEKGRHNRSPALQTRLCALTVTPAAAANLHWDSYPHIPPSCACSPSSPPLHPPPPAPRTKQKIPRVPRPILPLASDSSYRACRPQPRHLPDRPGLRLPPR